MHAPTSVRSVARALVDQLRLHGVRHVFTVPGESFLPVLDALGGSDIEVTACRQEGGAAMMAEAIGKATGRPGICFVTRGPGATNGAPALHIAQQDSTPMILFVGQIERGHRGREAFQEMDYRALFGSTAKWVDELDDGARVAELVSRAFHVATAGRPGPVVLSLPKDVLSELTAAPDAAPFRTTETAPGEAEMEVLSALLETARNPLFVLGGSRWNVDARARFMAFAERTGVAVATSYRRLPLFDPMHPCYAGDLGLGANPKLVERARQADFIALVGGRLGEIPSQGYRVLDVPRPRQAFVHVHPGAEELGRVYQPDLAIHATPARFVEALADRPIAARPEWRGEAEAAHRDYLAFSETPTDDPGALNLGAVMAWLRDALPADAILCNGAGNYASWIHRFFRFRAFGAHVAPTSASMGYGMPAAVAMQRLYPGRLVLCVAGDGDFLMNGQEFATAVQYDLPIVCIVCDNSMYGTIRMHQEREFPGRVVATSLRNPDFAAYARAFGGHGETVERTQDFPDAFARARATGMPSIVHLKTDPDAILPGVRLSAMRAKAPAAR
ncbi:MAG: thiamine pyrophosphate-binding protein [Hyphomicrobiales bacterium]|nr:thiamine pyrophosphate-binding protein [Hyphomicrobiales bacterium]